MFQILRNATYDEELLFLGSSSIEHGLVETLGTAQGPFSFTYFFEASPWTVHCWRQSAMLDHHLLNTDVTDFLLRLVCISRPDSVLLEQPCLVLVSGSPDSGNRFKAEAENTISFV